MQNKWLNILDNKDRRYSNNTLHHELKLLQVKDIHELLLLKFIHTVLIGNPVKRFEAYFIKRSQSHDYETRQADYIQTAKCKTTYGKRKVHYTCATKWNHLEETVKTMKSSAFKIAITEQQGKSEGLDSCGRRSNLNQIGLKSSDFSARLTLKFDGWLRKKYRAPLLHYVKLCASSRTSVNSNWSYFPETLNSGQNRRIFVPCDLEIWWMTLKNNRAPLLWYIQLSAPFQCHRWIQAGVSVRKRSIRVKVDDFLSRVTLKFDWWSWKTIGHLFYATSSYVHHFKAISKFKLEF